MASVNDKLKSSVAKARSAVHGKGVHFDFVTGSGGSALLIGEGSSVVGEAKKETKGSTVTSGVCYGHEGALVFETQSNPPGSLATQIQKCLRDHAGVSGKVEARSAAEIEEQQKESESHENPADKPDPVKVAKITAHVKALTAKLGGNFGSSNAGKALKAKLAEANTAYKKGDLDVAERVLKEGDGLVYEEQEHEHESEGKPNQ